MKLNNALWGGLCCLLGTAVLIHIQAFPAMPGQRYGPAVFPGVIASGFIVCGLLLLLRGFQNRGPIVELAQWARERCTLARAASLLAAILFYVLASEWLGFLLCGSMVLIFLFHNFGVPWTRAIVTALLATLAIHFLFYKVMRVPLPWGVLTPIAW